jgi:hypothetical protein
MDMLRLREFTNGGNGILVVATDGNKTHVFRKARHYGFEVNPLRGAIITDRGVVMVVTFGDIRRHRLKGLMGMAWWFAEKRMYDEPDIVELTVDLDMALRRMVYA